MPQIIRTVSVELGGGRNGTIILPDDVCDYFGIAFATTTATARVRTRKAYQRSLTTPLGAATTATKLVSVEASRWTDTPSPPRRGSGTKIIVPTEKKTTKGFIRKVTMNFPSGIVIGAVSNFLFTKCTKNKPTMFWTASGVPHLVVAVTGDVNPTPTPPPTPTPNPTPP